MWSRLFSLAQVSSWFSFSEEVEVARLAITFNKKLVEDSESTTIEEEIPIRVACWPTDGILRSGQTLTVFFTTQQKHTNRVSAALVTPPELAKVCTTTLKGQEGTITAIMTVTDRSVLNTVTRSPLSVMFDSLRALGKLFF